MTYEKMTKKQLIRELEDKRLWQLRASNAEYHVVRLLNKVEILEVKLEREQED